MSEVFAPSIGQNLKRSGLDPRRTIRITSTRRQSKTRKIKPSGASLLSSVVEGQGGVIRILRQFHRHWPFTVELSYSPPSRPISTPELGPTTFRASPPPPSCPTRTPPPSPPIASANASEFDRASKTPRPSVCEERENRRNYSRPSVRVKRASQSGDSQN